MVRQKDVLNGHIRLLLEPFCLPWTYVRRLTWYQVRNLYLKPSDELHQKSTTDSAINNEDPPSFEEFSSALMRAGQKLRKKKCINFYSEYIRGLK